MVGMESQPISKTEGARRQLETAIDLYFANADSLSVHTLAWASFKVLFDVYPKRQDDGFDAELDRMLTKEGWSAMSGVANFLKHADKDPDAFLASHHPQQGYSIIGLATLLYGRLIGELTLKMRAFDSWVEAIGQDEIGIPEIDENPSRAAAYKKIRDHINALPHDEYIKHAARSYHSYLNNFERLSVVVEKGLAEGKSFTQTFDEYLSTQAQK